MPDPSGGRRPIGYTITRYWCRDYAPEAVSDGYEPLREGDDHGVPYRCDDCGEPLLPCDHDWERTWNDAYTPEGAPPRQIRFCKTCGDADYRDIARPPSPTPEPDNREDTQ